VAGVSSLAHKRVFCATLPFSHTPTYLDYIAGVWGVDDASHQAYNGCVIMSPCTVSYPPILEKGD